MIESEHIENEQHRECEYKERGFHGFHPSILMDRWILGDTGWEVEVIIPNGVHLLLLFIRFFSRGSMSTFSNDWAERKLARGTSAAPVGNQCLRVHCGAEGVKGGSNPL